MPVSKKKRTTLTPEPSMSDPSSPVLPEQQVFHQHLRPALASSRSERRSDRDRNRDARRVRCLHFLYLANDPETIDLPSAAPMRFWLSLGLIIFIALLDLPLIGLLIRVWIKHSRNERRRASEKPL